MVKNVQKKHGKSSKTGKAKSQSSEQKKKKKRGGAGPQRTRSLVAPVARQRMGGYSQPVGLNRVRVRRTELAGSLTSPGGGAFHCVKIPMNPGLPSLAWLSGIASNYQQYKLKGLNLEFRTLEPTTTRGTVYMGVQYDVDQKKPVSEAEMSLMPESVSGPVWTSSMSCNVSPSRFHATNPTFFVRSQYVADLDRYDGANLIVAIVDHANPDTVGKFWVTYDFEFLVPSANLSSGSLKAGDVARQCMMVNGPTIAVAGSSNVVFDTVEVEDIPGVSYDATTGVLSVDQPMRIESDARVRVNNSSHSSGASDGYMRSILQPQADAVDVVELRTVESTSVPAAQNTVSDIMTVSPNSNGLWDLLPNVAYTIRLINEAASTVSAYAVGAGAATTWLVKFVGLLDEAGALLAATKHAKAAARQGVVPSDEVLAMAKISRLEFKRMLNPKEAVGTTDGADPPGVEGERLARCGCKAAGAPTSQPISLLRDK